MLSVYIVCLVLFCLLRHGDDEILISESYEMECDNSDDDLILNIGTKTNQFWKELNWKFKLKLKNWKEIECQSVPGNGLLIDCFNLLVDDLFLEYI